MIPQKLFAIWGEGTNGGSSETKAREESVQLERVSNILLAEGADKALLTKLRWPLIFLSAAARKGD